MQLSSLQNGSDIRGVAMGPQANLTAKEVDTLSRAFALWLAERTQHSALRVAVGMDARLSGPALKEACITALRPFCARLWDGQHTRYVYDNRIRSNTLRWRRDADC